MVAGEEGMSEEQSEAHKTEGTMRPMWIICQLDDSRWRRVVCEKVRWIVEEMSGEVERFSGIGDIVAVARFPHRKCKAVEKAVAAALETLPVKRTIVVGQDPYILRPRTMALTKELYERQDEVVGLSAPPVE